MRRWAVMILVFVLGAGLVAGCGPNLAAVVNGTQISVPQVEHYRQLQVLFASGQKSAAPTAQQALTDLVDQTLFVQAAQGAKDLPTAAEISSEQAYVQHILTSGIYSSAAAYQKELTSLGLTQAQVDAYVAEVATAQTYLHAAVKATPPTKAQIAAYYAAHRSSFKYPKEVKAYHILLKSKAQAQKLLAQLRATPAARLLTTFEALAKKYSQDTGSAPQGGYLGWVKPGEMVPSFNRAVFALKPGQLSGVVHSRFGYHIILVTAERGPGTDTLAQATPKIVTALQNQANAAAQSRLLARLKAKAKITYYPPYKAA